jgi:SNF2 family DNA or RNA helicase
MTLKVGGVGLNLTSADYVFIVDPWWNVAAENQAIDRVYRIGQKNKIFSYKLITKGSIEEKIIKLQEQKKALSDMIIKPDEIIKTLSKEEIDYILGE